MILPVFDSHLHLTDDRFRDDRTLVLERAREAGVTGFVSVASDSEDALRAVALAAAHRDVWATAGLHPHAADRFRTAEMNRIASLAESERVVAIGETGLDFHYEHAPREAQLRSFRAHLELAEATGLPAVVHTRAADAETAGLIEEFAGRAAGVLHCFTGGDRLLAAGLEAGWYVSFSGILTFGGEELEARAVRVPDDRLLIETDSPYLAPVPRRGRRNEPAYLVHTAVRLAELRGVSAGEIARLTTQNARRLYGLPGPERGPGEPA